MSVSTTAHLTTVPVSRTRIFLAGLGVVSATLLVFVFSLPVVVGIAVGVGLLVAVIFTEWALYLYVASLFLFQVPVLNGIPISVPMIAGALFLAVACFHRLRSHEEATRGSRLPLLMTILSLLYAVLALLNPAWTLAEPRGICTYLALFATTVAAAYELREPARAWRVCWVFCCGSAVVSLEAIYEEWTGHYNLAGLFPSQDARAYGLADPNYTAAFLVTALPLMVALFVRAWRLYLRVVLAGLTVLSIVGICMTASRGGAVGCIVVLIASALFVPFSRKCDDKPSPGLFGRRAGILALLLCMAGFAAYVAPQSLWDRLGTIEDECSSSGKEDRLQIWKDYLERWRQSPWLGQGAGFLEERGMEPHNTPLQNLVEVGVPGLAGFLLVNAFGFYESLSARRRFALQGIKDLSALSGAVVASLVGFHVTGFFLTSATHKELWFLLGFAAALSHASRSYQEAR